MRVAILGNSGSGKSTLARQLTDQHGLAVLDLDTIAWVPGKIAVPRPRREAHPLRPERTSDHPAIHALHVASFPTEGEARLVAALRSAGHLSVSLVAELAGRVVGHVAFSPVGLPGATGGVGLAPVAVLSAFRGRGIADQLIRAGLGACRQADAGFVVVLGDPAYYSRFGFLPARGWGLRDVYGGGDAFQALELRPGAIPSEGGQVDYAAEFADL
jgi:putative acetyltransferase